MLLCRDRLSRIDVINWFIYVINSLRVGGGGGGGGGLRVVDTRVVTP